jgi:hypothetical protein
MFLLRLKFCSRFTLFRRGIAEAVIELNPAGGGKLRSAEKRFKETGAHSRSSNWGSWFPDSG